MRCPPMIHRWGMIDCTWQKHAPCYAESNRYASARLGYCRALPLLARPIRTDWHPYGRPNGPCPLLLAEGSLVGFEPTTDWRYVQLLYL